MSDTRKISALRIPPSRRGETLPDIDELAESIRRVGLLHPVVIDKGDTLVAGQRRLAAVKVLGWQDVPVFVAEKVEDALSRLIAEADENTCRVDYTPTQAVAVKKDIEVLIAAEAKGRQRQGQEQGRRNRGKPAAEMVGADSAPTNGKTRVRVAKIIGMSHYTLSKAEAVVDAAKAEPERFGDLPGRMDKGSVDGAFKELRKRQTPTSPTAPKSPERFEHSHTLCDWISTADEGVMFLARARGFEMATMLNHPDRWDWPLVDDYLVPRLQRLRAIATEWLDRIADAHPERRKGRKARRPRPPRYPHSDRIIRWLGQTDFICEAVGGLDQLLSEPNRWDWRKVSTLILPALGAVKRAVKEFEAKLGDALEAHPRQKEAKPRTAPRPNAWRRRPRRQRGAHAGRGL